MPVQIAGHTLLTMRDVAERRGVKYQVVVNERHQGVLPPEDALVGRSPVWYPATIEAWQSSRPGRDWAANPTRAQDVARRSAARTRDDTTGRYQPAVQEEAS